jgi:methylphosphotriester-DNA--protein-cysteine methyltransferase
LLIPDDPVPRSSLIRLAGALQGEGIDAGSRLDEAALLRLEDADVPLAHVAHELGFSSQSHFTRMFSGLTRMTPAKYRRLHQRTVG